MKFTKLFKAIRILRLLKLMRLMKVGYINEEIEDRLGLSPAAMNLLMMLLQVFFVGHLVACVLFGMSTIITSNPWYAENVPTVHPDETTYPLSSQYILSLYWTFTIMSTVGYGDIYPSTTTERILNIFVILLGASMFGYMIANVSALIQSLTSSDAVKNEKIGVITEYLDEKQCPLKLQDAVVKHFRNFYKDASPYDVDSMLARLPPKLASQILLLHHEDTLKHIAVLRYIDNVSVRLYIFHMMKPVYYEPNEYILKQGTTGNEMLFLVEGRAVAFKSKEKKKLEKKKSRFSMLRPGKLLRKTSMMMGSMMGSPSSKKETKSGAPLLRERSNSRSVSFRPLGPPEEEAEGEGEGQEEESKTDTIFARRTRFRDFDSGDNLYELFDSEPSMPQSPPPPLPARMNKFNVSLRALATGWNDETDSDPEDEYQALRVAQTPHSLLTPPAPPEGELEEDVPTPIPQRSTFILPDFDTKPKGSKITDEYEESDDEDSEDEADHSHVKIDPTFTWTAANMEKKGMQMIGDISPGDFVGHLSLMYDTTNQASVVTSAFSTVYILNKQDISPMLSRQPMVSIQLQMALSRAISTQADVLGKFHMRQTRSKFLVHSKEDFYRRLAIRPSEVRSIRRAEKNKMKKLAFRIRARFMMGPASMKPQKSFYLSSGSNAHLNAGTRVNMEIAPEDDETATVLDEFDRHMSRVSTVMSNIRRSSIRLITSGRAAPPAAPAPVEVAPPVASRMRKLPRRIVRRVRQLEATLTKYSVLYESDDNKDEEGRKLTKEAAHGRKEAPEGSRKHRLHAHRTELPVIMTLRATSVRPDKAPAIAKRRGSFIGRAESNFFDRFLPKTLQTAAPPPKKLHRVVSLNDLDTLECAQTTTESKSNPATSEIHAEIVPIWTNRRALRHEDEILTRRQSFPSLENDLWKIGNTCQGLL